MEIGLGQRIALVEIDRALARHRVLGRDGAQLTRVAEAAGLGGEVGHRMLTGFLDHEGLVAAVVAHRGEPRGRLVHVRNVGFIQHGAEIVHRAAGAVLALAPGDEHERRHDREEHTCRHLPVVFDPVEPRAGGGRCRRDGLLHHGLCGRGRRRDRLGRRGRRDRGRGLLRRRLRSSRRSLRSLGLGRRHRARRSDRRRVRGGRCRAAGLALQLRQLGVTNVDQALGLGELALEILDPITQRLGLVRVTVARGGDRGSAGPSGGRADQAKMPAALACAGGARHASIWR